MNVYILASYNNIFFAEKLLEGIKNVKIISKFSTEEIISDIHIIIKKRIESADFILAIIDETFTETFHKELQFALDSLKSNKSQVMLPIVMNNAVVPKTLEEMRYIKCDSESKYDIYKTKEKIRKKLKPTKYKIAEIVPFLLFYIIALMSLAFINIKYSNSIENFFSTIIIAEIFAFNIVTYLSKIKRMFHEEEEKEIESYSRRLQKTIIPQEVKQGEQDSFVYKGTKKELDALGRMLVNLEDIKEFNTWSQKQAKASFVLAVSMCILGFVLMIAAIILPITFRLSFQMSIIPAVGGVITEFIAGTALSVYKKSLVQLNYYHKALHEDERFLSSVNLLGKFNVSKTQDDMLKEIIKSEIQMNLISLVEDNKKD